MKPIKAEIPATRAMITPQDFFAATSIFCNCSSNLLCRLSPIQRRQAGGEIGFV
jgi:hypothetical protein